MHDAPIPIGQRPLTIDEVVEIARNHARVEVSEAAWERVQNAHDIVRGLAEDTVPHYGVSTGFGALATKHIPVAKRAELQRCLVRSHAAGSGAEVAEEIVRSLMTLRIQTLASGHTGVRPQVLSSYVAMLNADITPVVYEYGSLGCSGDLAPLSHCALALMGEGVVRYQGQLMEAAEALAAHGISPVELAEKEGLALINGTDGMLGMLCLSLRDLRRLVTCADIVTAMSVDGLLGSDHVFAADLMALRPHPGQQASGDNLRRLMAGSAIRASHLGADDGIVQDAYSLRCSPQVTGAVRDTIDHAARVASWELASAIDNPVVIDGRVESNGNFHGAPVAYVLDYLAIAVADLASISERRTDRFCDKARNHGLPPFLAHDPGVDSGHMIAQYTAAGIVSELKRLASPASVDSIPSSAMQEDHVSMGWAAGLKLRRAIDGLTRVLAIELLTAARGIELRAPLTPSAPVGAVISALRDAGVPGPGPDRFVAPEIAVAVDFIRSGAAIEAASRALAQPLN
ncbi:MAG: histidine ammonia-lyase [Propionibacteriaceae bacterium]|nr:histidine ammonia-lyase [Propionibacteriaceae bacterium]